MYTIFETHDFSKIWPNYWTVEELGEFVAYLAQNPEVGDVERDSNGLRKVRWQRRGTGKSGGVRVVYFNRLENGQIWLITMYAKSVHDSLSKKLLRQLEGKLNDTL